MSAYYNENDPKAAAWLRELIKAGQVAPGEVDERSIEDVTPNDIKGYSQHHFFAGIGGWSYALRMAGWPDDHPIWTGSCPCQPFSAAGAQRGLADERHLWPFWLWLIQICRPDIVLGEQVANARDWFDVVQRDLQMEDYAVGVAVLGAHSVGAPHIRQRLYWVADYDEAGRSIKWRDGIFDEQRPAFWHDVDGRSSPSKLAQPNGRDTSAEGIQRSGQYGLLAQDCSSSGLEHSSSDGREQRGAESGERSAVSGCGESSVEQPESKQVGFPGCTWFDGRPADWIECRDAKWRPVEPGTFPLAHGISGRVGLLRGYGNAIVPQAAASFVKAYLGA